MTDPESQMQIRTIGSMSEVSAEMWDACAGQSNPFVKHGFLSCLEDSGSATADSGWAAQHVLLEDSGSGALRQNTAGTDISIECMVTLYHCVWIIAHNVINQLVLSTRNGLLQVKASPLFLGKGIRFDLLLFRLFLCTI